MYLPEDVILEILLRLPVPSLLRFRCVCRRWCALIKSSSFNDNYLALRHAMDEGDDVFAFNRMLVKRHGYGTSFVTCCYSDYESLLALSVSSSSSSTNLELSDIFPSEKWMRIINHVNGIVCCAGENLFSTSLLNPCNREVRKLPVPDLGFKFYTQGLGLGFDSATNDYKVIGIVTVVEGGEGPYNRHLALVYRLSTNTWTILGELPAFVSQYYYQVSPYYSPNRIKFLGWAGGPMACIFSHGSIHWLVEANKNLILTLDMTSELFQEIQFPHALKDYKYGMQYKLFTVDRSTIALVAFSFPSDHLKNPQWLDVWVMKEYGVTESWTKQYSIRSLPERVRPLSLWRKDKLLLQTKHGELICYDLSRGQMCGPYLRGVCVETCNESLVSVK